MTKFPRKSSKYLTCFDVKKPNDVQVRNLTDDVIDFECTVCGYKQRIVATHDEVNDMANDIFMGTNPFEDGWEDGIGNTIYCDCRKDGK